MKFLTWGENLGRPECPYVKRWVLNFGLFSIRLHHWISSDDQRNFHDHAWWYVTFILRGGYLDRSPGSANYIEPGQFAFRRATHQHTVYVPPEGCWSILLTGPEKREWGFWVDGRFVKRNKYFFRFGQHICD